MTCTKSRVRARNNNNCAHLRRVESKRRQQRVEIVGDDALKQRQDQEQTKDKVARALLARYGRHRFQKRLLLELDRFQGREDKERALSRV